MVKINSIVTKSGDLGLTYLADGSKVQKSSSVVKLLGKLDTLNVNIGSARLILTEANEQQAEMLLKLQNRLFDFGAELALAKNVKKIADSDYKKVEEWIAATIVKLPELKSFILPVSNQINNQTELARVIAREFELMLLEYYEDNIDCKNGSACIFVNRLNDFLFALSWYHTDKCAEKKLWALNQEL